MGKQVYIPEEKIKFNKFKSTLKEHLHLARQYIPDGLTDPNINAWLRGRESYGERRRLQSAINVKESRE